LYSLVFLAGLHRYFFCWTASNWGSYVCFMKFTFFLGCIRFGKQENSYHSTWGQRPICVACHNQDQETEQACGFTPQVCHEKGLPEDGKGTGKPGNYRSQVPLDIWVLHVWVFCLFSNGFGHKRSDLVNSLEAYL